MPSCRAYLCGVVSIPGFFLARQFIHGSIDRTHICCFARRKRTIIPRFQHEVTDAASIPNNLQCNSAAVGSCHSTGRSACPARRCASCAGCGGSCAGRTWRRPRWCGSRAGRRESERNISGATAARRRSRINCAREHALRRELPAVSWRGSSWRRSRRAKSIEVGSRIQ